MGVTEAGSSTLASLLVSNISPLLSTDGLRKGSSASPGYMQGRVGQQAFLQKFMGSGNGATGSGAVRPIAAPAIASNLLQRPSGSSIGMVRGGLKQPQMVYSKVLNQGSQKLELAVGQKRKWTPAMGALSKSCPVSPTLKEVPIIGMGSGEGNVGSGDHSGPKTKKCRKVYGLNQKNLWCTQCQWKKACARFKPK